MSQTATVDTAASYSNYQNMVATVSTAIADLEKICGELRMEENRKDLEKIRKKLAEHRFAVGVMGEFKRGKSTVINSLLESEIMPSDILPCSATMNRVTYDLHPHVVLHMRDGSQRDISVERLASYVTKLNNENESRAAEVDEAVVYYPCRFCQNGVDIVDTPGLNDDERMNKISEEVIPKLDTVIMVITPDNPFSMSEAEFVRSKLMTSDVSRLIFLVNKIDQVRRKADRSRVVEGIRTKIQTSVLERTATVYGLNSKEYKNTEMKLGKITVFPISALDALDGKLERDQELIEQSGTIPFENTLTRILTEERGALELSTPLTAIQRTSDEIIKTAATRKNSLELSAKEFHQRQSEALEKIRQMRTMKQEEKMRLRESASDAKLRMEDMVSQFYPNLRNKLLTAVEQEAAKVNLETLTDEAHRQAATEQLQNAAKKTLEYEMSLISEKVQNEMKEIIGDEAAKMDSFISNVSAHLDQVQLDLGAPSKMLTASDIVAGGVGSLGGAALWGLGGVVAGYKEAGIKGALVGGGAGFVATFGSASLAAMLLPAAVMAPLTIPLSMICGVAGALAGKFLTKAIFKKDAGKKELDKIRKSVLDGVESMLMDMQSQRELENWASRVTQEKFDELIAGMEGECERMLRDTESNMEAIRQDLMENEFKRKQMGESIDKMVEEVKRINDSISAVNDKVCQVLKDQQEGARYA